MEESNGGEVKDDSPNQTATLIKEKEAVDEKKIKVDPEGNPTDKATLDQPKNGALEDDSAASTEVETDNNQVEKSAVAVKSQDEKAESSEPIPLEPEVELKIVFNKKQLPIRISLSKTVGNCVNHCSFLILNHSCSQMSN